MVKALLVIRKYPYPQKFIVKNPKKIEFWKKMYDIYHNRIQVNINTQQTKKKIGPLQFTTKQLTEKQDKPRYIDTITIKEIEL